MTRLLLINGLPGTGKSTLASRYCADRPLSVCLDIDVVRGLLGGWHDRPLEAGLFARRLALAMIHEAVPQGHDVVVPQLLARVPFIDELQHAAEQLHAQFCEIVLFEPPVRTVARLHDRAACPQTPAQRDAHALLERDGGVATIPGLHQRLLAMLEQRPQARILEPIVDDVEQTYRDLLELLPDEPTGPARG